MCNIFKLNFLFKSLDTINILLYKYKPNFRGQVKRQIRTLKAFKKTLIGSGQI